MEQYITDEDIMNHIHMQLLKLGYAPGQQEVDDLTDIFFDYLTDIGIIEVMDEELDE